MIINIKNNLPKLNAICGTDELRAAMMHVQVKDNKAHATNAHVALIVELDVYFDEQMPDCYILGSDWKKMAANNVSYLSLDKAKGIIEIHSKKGTEIIKIKTADDLPGKYPDFDAVIPAFNGEHKGDRHYTFGFNAGVLTSLCDVFGKYANLRFQVTLDSRAIRVDLNTEPRRAYGCIMPVLINHF